MIGRILKSTKACEVPNLYRLDLTLSVEEFNELKKFLNNELNKRMRSRRYFTRRTQVLLDLWERMEEA